MSVPTREDENRVVWGLRLFFIPLAIFMTVEHGGWGLFIVAVVYCLSLLAFGAYWGIQEEKQRYRRGWR